MQCDLSKGCAFQSCHCPPCHSWQGEICLCTSRILVQKSIYSEFFKRFVEATRMWKVGVPSDPPANMGALISQAHLEKVSEFLQWKLQKNSLFGGKPSTRCNSHPYCKLLLIATLFLKNCDLWKIVSEY